jgi:hypothetical protein
MRPDAGSKAGGMSPRKPLPDRRKLRMRTHRGPAAKALRQLASGLQGAHAPGTDARNLAFRQGGHLQG